MGRIKTRNGNLRGMCMFLFQGHFQVDECKPKGLELVAKANGTHIFRLEIPFGNFGLPFKKSRFLRKCPDWEDQISPSIYIPTKICGFYG